jgi:hypothetical protein
MKRIRSNRVAVPLLLSFLLVAGCATTKDLNTRPGAPQGFRSLHWGALPANELAVDPSTITGDLSVYRPAPGRKPRPLFGVAVAEEAYSFYKGQFFSGSAWMDGDENLARIKAALTKRYGEPAKQISGYDRHSTTSEPQRSAYKDMWVWAWPDSTAQVRLSFHAIHRRATVTYINEAIRKSATAPAKKPAAAEKAAATP